MPLLTIASLTLREAVRRRIVLVGSIASLVLAVLSAWGLARLTATIPNRTVQIGIVSTLTIFLAFVFSVVLAIGAAFVAAPAIASDIESGVALSVLPRPLSRAEFVLGKWLGLTLLIAAYATIFGAIELSAIALATGYEPPHPGNALLFLIAQSNVMLSLALLLSTRLPAVASGLLAVLCFGIAWIAGITAPIAGALHNAGVLHAATLVGLLFPTDGLWRGALYNLEPVAILVASNVSGAPPNPFATTSSPTLAFTIWCLAWIAAAVAGAVVSFQRRDV
jgi:ABC-type transport system involved in multi-copper enzyme maturation permease subunit